MMFNDLVVAALAKAGKQETLAILLDMGPSSLSKRMNGEVGWMEKEVNKLLEYTGLAIHDPHEQSEKIETLKNAMKILLNGEKS